MSTIEFVVRNSAGAIQRGFVGGEAGSPLVFAQPGADISLNLGRGQIAGYSRDGDALEVLLADGRTIIIDNFFDAAGQPVADLYISSDGLLAQVQLAAGSDGGFFANYVDQDVFGKWSPEDDLYFVGGETTAVATPYAAGQPEVGMLAGGLPLLGSMGLPLVGLVGLGLGTAVLGDDDEREDPEGEILTGTKDVGHVVNAEDHADGVEIGGTGTPGATVTVEIDGVTETTVIGDDGTWNVIFDPDEVDTGTYETPVTVVIEKDDRSITIEDVLVVDTEVALTFDEDATGGDGTVNGVEQDGVVTLSGTVEAGSTVVVNINGVDYTAVVFGENWTVDLPANLLPEGELTQTATVTATDIHGNSTTVTGDFEIDTETAVTIATGLIGGNGTVNGSEHAAGFNVTGTAEAGASVVVTIGSTSHTVTANASGQWTATFLATEVAGGTYAATVTAVATDAAGNTATTSGTFQIDTETHVTVNTAIVETDGVVNYDERSDGVTLTGTAEAGAVVAVTLAGTTVTVTANADGTWAATFATLAIPQGELDAAVTVTATDAAGNSATVTDAVTIDTYVNLLTITSGPVGGDGVLNLVESQQAITVSGQVELGSSVVVTLAGVQMTATVTNGVWTVTYPAGSLPGGEYMSQLVVTATDPAGNTATTTEPVRVDTVAGEVAISDLPVEGNDIVNRMERADGVTIHGTATPGLIVTVTLGTVSHQVLAAPDGTWSTVFAASEIPAGTYDAPIKASITDAAGNYKEDTDSVHIDTELPLTLATPVEGDNIISGAEALDGVTFSGTTEVGATVVVSFAGLTRTVIATDGTWAASFTAAEIPAGEADGTVTAVATDRAGNTEDISHDIRIDRIVNLLNVATPVEGDDLVNREEAADGVTLTGMVEAGSRVMVTFEGITREATVTPAGAWSVTFAPGEIPQGEYDATVTVHATDAVGNTDEISHTFAVDTTPPEAPLIASYTRGAEGVRALSTEATDETIDIHRVAGNGTVTEVSHTVTEDPVRDEVRFSFNESIPNGSHLVMTASDATGNATSTLFVLEETLTNTVNVSNAGLDGFNIEAIDLQFAEDSVLTLTAADLESLAAHSNTLTIHGGADDVVNIAGAQDTGETEVIGGRTYNIFSLGTNGGTLIIDEAITVNH